MQTVIVQTYGCVCYSSRHSLGIPLSQIRLRFRAPLPPEKTPCIPASFPSVRGDLDAYGHLNNTLLPVLRAGEGRMDRSGGFRGSSERREAPVIINASCTFLVPVNYPPRTSLYACLRESQA